MHFIKVLTRKNLASLKGGDGDAIGNQIRPRTGLSAVGTNPMYEQTGGWQSNN